MAWPAEETPTSGGVWLECNGQTIPSKYKRLRELIGNKTPDYRGMFLRGYGSQTATVYAGLANGNMTFNYQSGNLGEIQGDAIRPMHTDDSFGLFASNDIDLVRQYPNIDGGGHWGGSWAFSRPFYDLSPERGKGYWQGDTYYAEVAAYGLPTLFDKELWVMTRPPKKYSLSGHGGDHASYFLNEYDDTSDGEYMRVWAAQYHMWTEIGIPTANEARPINIAVRYFIKAR